MSTPTTLKSHLTQTNIQNSSTLEPLKRSKEVIDLSLLSSLVKDGIEN